MMKPEMKPELLELEDAELDYVTGGYYDNIVVPNNNNNSQPNNNNVVPVVVSRLGGLT